MNSESQYTGTELALFVIREIICAAGGLFILYAIARYGVMFFLYFFSFLGYL